MRKETEAFLARANKLSDALFQIASEEPFDEEVALALIEQLDDKALRSQVLGTFNERVANLDVAIAEKNLALIDIIYQRKRRRRGTVFANYIARKIITSSEEEVAPYKDIYQNGTKTFRGDVDRLIKKKFGPGAF